MSAENKITGLQLSQKVNCGQNLVSGDLDSQAALARRLGLCSTCIHASGCRLYSSPHEPILFCAEFDSGVVPASERPSGPETRSQFQGSVRETGRRAARRLGLCVNCFHQNDCRLPRPEGGVWYCEEYE